MKVLIRLLEVFVIAIIIAFIITFMSGTIEIRLISSLAVIPQIVLTFVFIYYCKKKKFWSYVGSFLLGSIGLILRVIISMQPTLEVGGGLPVSVSTLYIVLATLVILKSYESLLELRV